MAISPAQGWPVRCRQVVRATPAATRPGRCNSHPERHRDAFVTTSGCAAPLATVSPTLSPRHLSSTKSHSRHSPRPKAQTMSAFTPTPPPPTPEHLLLITEALCARAAARNTAATASTHKRRLQFQHELSLLRRSLSTATPTTNNPTPPPVHATPTGAAAVLHARITRIMPTVTDAVNVEDVPMGDAVDVDMDRRVAEYHHRMARYQHVPLTPAPTTATAPAAPVTPGTTKSPIGLDHVLPAAPVRAAIPSARVSPLIAGTPQANDRGVAQSTAPEAEMQVEQVRRPSLVDAIVNAFTRFVDSVREKKDDEGERGERDRSDAVAIGAAAAQVLAVFASLGKQ